MKDKIRNTIYGAIVADALGVPVEFKDRALLKKKPVTDMIGYGTYNLPILNCWYQYSIKTGRQGGHGMKNTGYRENRTAVLQCTMHNDRYFSAAHQVV